MPGGKPTEDDDVEDRDLPEGEDGGEFVALPDDDDDGAKGKKKPAAKDPADDDGQDDAPVAGDEPDEERRLDVDSQNQRPLTLEQVRKKLKDLRDRSRDGDDVRAEIKRLRKLEGPLARKAQAAGRAASEHRIRELEGTVAQLNERLGDVGQRQFRQDIGQVDQQITGAKGKLAAATRKISEALANGDGDAMANAIEERDTINRELWGLEGLRARADRVTKDGGRQRQAPARVDPLVKRNGDAFRRANPWFRDDDATDPDSAVVSAIDAALTAEGYDPRQRDYWDELEERAKERLPHRFEADDPEPDRRRRPVGARGPNIPTRGDQSRGSPSNGARNGKGYYLSAERIDALKKAGKWGDPAERAKATRAYAKYDAEHPELRRAAR